MTTGARDTTRALPFGRAARGVFTLSFDSMIWSRRSLFMGLFIGLPVLLSLLFRLTDMATRIGGEDFYHAIVVLFYVRNALPLMALFYATALIAEEVEGGTLTYLLARPVPRPAILAGKFAAYLTATLTLALPAVVGSFVLLVSDEGFAQLGSALPDLMRDLAVVALTLLAYGALFALLGVALRRPVIPGLVFLLVWELLANAPGYISRFTLSIYARYLVSYRAIPGINDGFSDPPSTAASVAALCGISVVCLSAAAMIFSRREYVSQQ
jgi:ABC-2 type transport system permease protein